MKRWLTVMLFALAFAGATQAADLMISITDPVGDVVAGIDTTGVRLDFNNTTGAFTFTATADAARPFIGNMVFNLNLYNVDAAARTTPTVGFFTSSNPRNLLTPQTSLTVSGVDSRLTSWNSGDRVAFNDVPFGAPTQFGANVYSNCSSAGCAYSDPFGARTASDFTTISLVPSDCTITDLGSQVLVRSTGWSHSFRAGGDVALEYRGTNLGTTPVLNPFVLILNYRTGNGSPVTILGPTTTCLSDNPLHYVPLARRIMPGASAKAAAVFDVQGTGFYGGIRVTWRTNALGGLR